MEMTDNELTTKGMGLLMDQLGTVEAERFVCLMTRDRFDYTEWQKSLFKGESVRSLASKIAAFEAASKADSMM